MGEETAKTAGDRLSYSNSNGGPIQQGWLHSNPGSAEGLEDLCFRKAKNGSLCPEIMSVYVRA
jgi:hypothetical protein